MGTKVFLLVLGPVSEKDLLLILCHVGQEVYSYGMSGPICLVVLGDLSHILVEQASSVLVLFLGTISLAVLGNVLVKECVVWSLTPEEQLG